VEPLASFGNSKSQSHTNLSRSVSLSILDLNENEVAIEIIIPQDPNFIIPKMIVQNVISQTPYNQII
jgi:hypothetical protein